MTTNNTFDALHYSVLSFLESKERSKEESIPLDLSIKATKSEKHSSNYLRGPTIEEIENNVLSSTNDRKIKTDIKFPRKDVSPQFLYSNLYRYFDDAIKCRAEFTSTNQSCIAVNPTWRNDQHSISSRQHGSFFNFLEPTLPTPFLSSVNKDFFLSSFFSSPDPRRMFPDVYSRSIYKLPCKDTMEKLSNSITIRDKDNIYGVCASPLGSAHKRRKRTKVTDSRLLKRNAMDTAINSQMDEMLADTTTENRCSSPSQSSTSEDITNDPKKYTLTPIHLRKAKLMFLFTRYPNSQMLKNYFPDIIFYKQNTAQLVKWFSNFREFYYSEMEKAVQRLMSTGVKFSSDIFVSDDCELFKNLMTHFNKNRQIEIPKEFMIAVQITLREFYDAISLGKNLHQSWKKPIYKTIAKLDQAIPEFFKDFNWMLELAKEEQGLVNHSN